MSSELSVLIGAAVRTVDLVAARAASKSECNHLLAAALRSNGLAAGGETWVLAKDALAVRLSYVAVPKAAGLM